MRGIWVWAAVFAMGACGDDGAPGLGSAGDGTGTETGTASGPLNCGPGELICGGTCRDPSSDVVHCGRCGNPCSLQESCVSGQCVLGGATGGNDTGGATGGECAAGTQMCGRDCVNTDNDPAHCGRCGNDCGDSACEDGQCQVDGCQDAPNDCDGVCTDLQTDPLNCKECGSACDVDELCEGGNCRQYETPQDCNECPCDECQDQFDQCCVSDFVGGVVCLDSSSCP